MRTRTTDSGTNVLRISALLLSIVVGSFNSWGQVAGSINGAVVDASQAWPFPALTLALTNTQTGDSRQLVSSEQGFFNFTDVPRGEYIIKLNAQGFRELIIGPVLLTVGQQMTIHPKLEVGSVSETVEVSATPPPVTTSTSSLSELVDSRRIEQLPLNGRNVLQLVSLLPGVVPAGNGGQFGAVQTTFSVSGGRNVDMNFTLDGGINMNPFYSIPNEYPNPDALQEFSATTRNYSAVFGRGTSAVTAVTRSGSNEFHGTLFEFVRNTDLDSRPFFAAQRSVFKRNQYGGTIGGPILKNKLFFFASYQGTKARGTPGMCVVFDPQPGRTHRRFLSVVQIDHRPGQWRYTFPGQYHPGVEDTAIRLNFCRDGPAPPQFRLQLLRLHPCRNQVGPESGDRENRLLASQQRQADVSLLL